MNIDFPQELGSAGNTVFASLRAKLAREVESSAMLADLLEKLNGMQEAQARPADFKERFDMFVARAEEYPEVVRPFIPALVQFLPAHMGSFGDREVSGTESAGLNRHIVGDATALQARRSDSILASSLALESLSRGVRRSPK